MSVVCPITGYWSKDIINEYAVYVFADGRGRDSHIITEAAMLMLETTPQHRLEMLDSRLYEAKDEMMTGNVIPMLIYTDDYGFEWTPQPWGF